MCSAQGKRPLSAFKNAEIKTLLADLLGLEQVRQQGALAADVVKQLKAGLAVVRQGLARAQEDAAGVEGIDLKMSGSVPFVFTARIFALACGVTATNTVDRLEAAGSRKGVPADEVRSWVDAFEHVQLLRLRTQHRRASGDITAAGAANVVPLSDLSALDRRILKEALRQVRAIQQRLEMDYPG